MCQAYKFLARDPRTSALATDSALPRYVKKRGGRDKGDSHYWIDTGVGLMDLNFGPGEKPYERFWPYAEGPRTANSWGFHPWKDDQRYPANHESRKIMDAVWRGLGERSPK
jgi:hypothetical protein